MSTPPPPNQMPSYTPAGGGSVPVASPYQAPQKKSSTGCWIAGGCGCLLLLVAGIIGAIFLFGGGVFFLNQGPREAVNTYYQSAEERDCEAMKSVIPEERRDTFSCTTFRSQADAYYERGDIDYKVTSSEVKNNRATVEVDMTIKRDSGIEKDATATFSLKKDGNGDWVIVSLSSPELDW